MPRLGAVDSQLSRVNGRRIVRLHKEDLPELARAFVAIARGRARAGVATVAGTSFVEIVGNGGAILIRSEDWARIAPFVKDESFNPVLNPAKPSGTPIDPLVAFNEQILDHADKQLYIRTLGILTGLFTDEFPTRSY